MPTPKKKTTRKPLSKKPTTSAKKPAAAKKAPAGKKPARKAIFKKAKGGARKSVGKKPANKKKKLAPKPVAASSVKENPEAHALAKRIANLLVEKKATDVVVLDVRGQTSYADYLVLASGESDRQVTSMANFVEATLKQEGAQRKVGSEGQQGGNWVLIDYGDVVAHLFLADSRSFYDLEGMWADAKKERVA